MNKVMVKINGSEYPMVGNKSEQEMRNVANYVDKEMSRIKENNPRLSLSVAAIVTALNITDILFECSELNDEMHRENEALKSKVGTPNEEMKLELENLKLEIDNKTKEVLSGKARVEELSKLTEEQKGQMAELSDTLEKCREEVDKYKQMIEELKTQAEEANERARIAESLSSEFQNKAYSLQLKFTELENEVKDLKQGKI